MDDIVANIGSVPAVISKDECIYCFETCHNKLHQEGPQHSLNVCLNCFQTVCPRHVTLHRQAAFVCQDAQHDSYLHLWKVEKEKPSNGQEEQANKKLKLEVLELNEADTFATLWEVIKYLPMSDDNDTEMGKYDVMSSRSQKDAPTPEFIDRILAAKSQTAMDQTHSWELTINSCEHIHNFQPAVPEQKVNINLSDIKCKDCELTNNLWLCLHCGNIGCGRKQVGIEGHSHALAHYDSHKTHTLAVKLGSLSSTTNDIYCYSCDDEVRFPDNNKLQQILSSQYGIDLSKINQAQEKTLTELQVEQNMQWDFRMTDSQGKELVLLPSGEPYGLGLQNLGNSCYMNSILQVLFHDSKWVESLIEKCGGVEFPRDVMYPATNLRCQWIKLYRAIKLESQLYANGIKPTSFKRCVTQGNEEFSSQRQQDAMEFFTYLMDRFDTIGDVTQFMLSDKLVCSQCHGVKYTEQISNSVQVPLPEDEKLRRGLKLSEQLSKYFQTNDDESIRFDCSNCHGSMKATKQLSMNTAPELLVLNVMRMQIDKSNWSVKKTSDLLEYESRITLNQYMTIHDPEESILQEEESQYQFTPRSEVLTQLMEMGFSQEACTKALYHTGNGSDGDIAVQWLFEHIEDPDINKPLVITTTTTTGNDTEYEYKAQEMTQMGLSYGVCLKALKLNNGDVNRSVEWVFNHPNDDGTMDEEEEEKSKKGTKRYGYEGIKDIYYDLLDVVCHKGNSVQSGHYVEFHRDSIEQPWVLYNDEKMVEIDTEEEIQCNGYIYVYKRM